MTIRRKNPRLQGLLGLSAAIDWFTRNDYFVAIPLNDCQRWDLVVESVEESIIELPTTLGDVATAVGHGTVRYARREGLLALDDGEGFQVILGVNVNGLEVHQYA